MTYSRNNIWEKRLPRGLGIIVLLFSLTTIFWLSRNTILFGTKAAVGNIPKDIQISNISDKTFTISYVTDESVLGSVSYGKELNLGSVALDERDGNSGAPHRVHYVSISNLTPSTKYFFSILSGTESFLNNAVPYEVTTASSSASPNQKTQVAGQVTLDDGSMPLESIAYVSSDNSQLLSTLLKPDGSYALELNNIRKKDLSGILTFSPDTIFHMNVSNSTLKSRVSFIGNQANPIPPIILSKDYDFSISTEPLSSTPASESAQITGFPTPEEDPSSSGPQILTPKTEQEFKDQQPLFQGTALPGNDVEITIQSEEEITTTVQADSNGKWQYRPSTKLAPGQHNITIKTLDASGLVKTLTQSFTVFAEGSQFIEPSISPTVTTTPTAQPTPTTQPTAVPTLSPTASPTPIVITTTPVVSTPSASPIPNITTPPIPKSGSSALVFGIIGAILSIGIGGLIFLLI